MLIQTARGPVESSELGVTLAHEHLAISTDGVAETFPRTYDRAAATEAAVAMVLDAVAAGAESLIDVTVLGLGRDIRLIADVAARVPAHIVVATGIYTFGDVPAYFKRRSVDDMADVFVDDIRLGIGDSGIRAGMLKCATDEPGVTPGVDMVLRACARAHRRTGCPITTHTHAATRRGLEQIAIFEDEGVDLSTVVIGHCGDTNDIDYLEAVAAKGCILGMDRFGVGNATNPQDARIATVVEMWKRGWGAQMVVSHDCPCTIDWFPSHPMGPGRSIRLIFDEVLPALRDAGMGDDDIAQLMVHTPRRFLEGSRTRASS
jgi:phosphotriesterase-related protein